MVVLPLLFLATFLAWAWTLLSALLDMNRRARARTTGVFTSTRAEWAALADWWRDPARRGQRRRLLALSLLLVVQVLVWESLGLDA